MKILILTEGGARVGLGHVTRCIAIAQAFKKSGNDVRVLANADIYAQRRFKKEKIIYKVFDWMNDIEKAVVLTGGKDLVIIDSYLAPSSFFRSLSRSIGQSRIVALDDYNRLNYNAGTVINPSISGEKMDYKVSPCVTYLSGRKYIILRREYWKSYPKPIKKEIGDVLITLGGVVDSVFLEKLLRFLVIRFPGYKYHVVGNNTIQLKIKEKIKNHHDLAAREMISLMLKADIAISGGGQTLYELARLGVPTIGICFSKNQLVNSRGFYKNGFLMQVLKHKEKLLLKKIAAGIVCLKNKKAREDGNIIGKSLVDGQGALRLAEYFDSFSKGLLLRKANMDDSRELLSWRNNISTRKASFNTEKISAKTHNRWLADNIKSNKANIYIALNNKGEKIGQVRLEKRRGTEAFISVNLNPKFFGLGLGSRVIAMGTRLFMEEKPEVKKVLAEIIAGNATSLKSFRNAGYLFSRYGTRKNKRIAVFKYAV